MDDYTLSALFLSSAINDIDYDVLANDSDLIKSCIGLNTDAINDLVVAKYL